MFEETKTRTPRLTHNNRQRSAKRDQIQAAIEQVVLEELQRLWRHVRVKMGVLAEHNNLEKIGGGIDIWCFPNTITGKVIRHVGKWRSGYIQLGSFHFGNAPKRTYKH
jgi:hypothetical protein